MHDESPAGIALMDRSLAYWKDPNNFDTFDQGRNG